MPRREPRVPVPAGQSRRRDAEGTAIVPCSRCPVRTLCLPSSVGAEHVGDVQGMVARQRMLRTGEALYRAGEPFSHLYAVRSGCLKTTVLDPDGGEHILNFHLAGEVLGFAAIYQERQSGNAVAVGTSNVCFLSFTEILRLAQRFPSLMLGLLRIASRSALYTGRLTGDHNATVRVAAFLLSLSGRLRAQGRPATSFELAMSREDIANHLRLAPETVSRVLTQVGADGIIEVRRRSVKLLDPARLQALAGPMLPYG